MDAMSALLEAVERFVKAEEQYKQERETVANLLKQAAQNNQVTNLARATGINRTTIYWLMNTWSTNENGSTQRNSQ